MYRRHLQQHIGISLCVINSNPVEVVRRYWDWAMLDSVRRARASNWFQGTSLYSKERKETMLKAEAEIRGRYSSEEFESLKRNVFGISLEKRAEVAGLSQLYDASYRVLSRNVHAMDVAVMEITRSASAPEEHKELLEARTSHLLEMAQWCLGTLALPSMRMLLTRPVPVAALLGRVVGSPKSEPKRIASKGKEL